MVPLLMQGTNLIQSQHDLFQQFQSDIEARRSLGKIPKEVLTQRDRDSRTLLHIACGKNNLEAAEAISNQLIELNMQEGLYAVDDHQWTPTHEAIEYNGPDWRTALMMIKKLPEDAFRMQYRGGCTLLHFALREGMKEPALAIVERTPYEALMLCDWVGQPLRLANDRGLHEVAAAISKKISEEESCKREKQAVKIREKDPAEKKNLSSMPEITDDYVEKLCGEINRTRPTESQSNWSSTSSEETALPTLSTRFQMDINDWGEYYGSD